VGSGPPLLLLPLLLAPSQWEPLAPALSEHYCTIALGGAFLGSVAVLEARGRGIYLGMIRTLLDIARIRPGEVVLEVGCGSGVVMREIALRTNRLLGLDMSPYLLREARALAERKGCADAIEFREGRAEALPFPDSSIDVALACTILEEGDADPDAGRADPGYQARRPHRARRPRRRYAGLGEFAGWRHDQGQGGGARPIRRGGRRQWLR
jgi:SAM-dependent methyltransferase